MRLPPPPHLHSLECEGIYVTQNNETHTFTSLDALSSQLSEAQYANIIALSISGIKQINHIDYIGAIEKLPPGLQSLNVRDCNGLKMFPTCLTAAVHTVHLVNTRVCDIPDISHLVNLECLNMYGSNISVIDRPLPPSLRTLVMDHNRLREIDYDLLPPLLAKLSVAHNSLRVAPPEHLIADVDFHDNAIINQRRFVERVLEKQKADNIYAHSQNVHDTAIQDSVRKSINVLFSIEQASEASEASEVTFVEVTESLKERIKKAYERSEVCASNALNALNAFDESNYLTMRRIILGANETNAYKNDMAFVDAMVQIPTTIGTTGLTIAALLERAYIVAKNHKNSDELFLRLGQELYEGRDMCFTGKISRIINAFVGFVDGITIEVSPRAELHARINAILCRKLKTHGNEKLQKLYEEFLGIISNHCNMAEAEFDAWLDAYHEL